MDKKQIIALLNKDLQDEHGAIIQYLTHAYGMGEGEMTCEIEAMARDEMRHLDWLAEQWSEANRRDPRQHAEVLWIMRGLDRDKGLADYEREWQRHRRSKNRHFKFPRPSFTDADAVVEHVSTKIQAEDVRQELTEHEFAAIKLTSVHDLSQAEAAAIMGVSKATLRRLIDVAVGKFSPK